jgi:hypothetical protein
MHPDNASRHGKGINSGVINDYKLQSAILKVTVSDQIEHKRLYVTVKQRVI